jgi:hypothetical protein
MAAGIPLISGLFSSTIQVPPFLPFTQKYPSVMSRHLSLPYPPFRLAFFLLAFSLLWLNILPGQVIREGSFPFMRNESANGLSIIIQGQPKNVEHVLDEMFKEQTGQRVRTRKGMSTIEEGRFRDISRQAINYFYSVEKPSRNDETHSQVLLFLSAGNNNFLDSSQYPREMQAARDLLSGLELEVMKYELAVVIEEQQKVLDKAIKDHEKMVKDSIDLEIQLAETLNAIEQNKIDRANQLETIEQEREELGTFEENLRILQNQEGYREDEDNNRRRRN